MTCPGCCTWLHTSAVRRLVQPVSTYKRINKNINTVTSAALQLIKQQRHVNVLLDVDEEL